MHICCLAIKSNKSNCESDSVHTQNNAFTVHDLVWHLAEFSCTHIKLHVLFILFEHYSCIVSCAHIFSF